MKIATPSSPALPMDMNFLFIYLIEGFCTFFFEGKDNSVKPMASIQEMCWDQNYGNAILQENCKIKSSFIS